MGDKFKKFRLNRDERSQQNNANKTPLKAQDGSMRAKRTNNAIQNWKQEWDDDDDE